MHDVKEMSSHAARPRKAYVKNTSIPTKASDAPMPTYTVPTPKQDRIQVQGGCEIHWLSDGICLFSSWSTNLSVGAKSLV